MSDRQAIELKRVTEEIYKKNLDLVNLNTILALLQRLYEITITASGMKQVTQQFIDVVIEKLNLRSGLIALKTVDGRLEIVALTSSEANKRARDIVGGEGTVKLSLGKKENLLVKAFLSRKIQVSDNYLDLWKPLISVEATTGKVSFVDIKSTVVYPITYAQQTLGAFAVSLGRDDKRLSDFEKTTLDRVVTVFGVAIDRIYITQQLRQAQANELVKAKEVIQLKEEIDARKDEFISVAAHQLRTPLGSMRWNAEMLLSGEMAELDPEVKESIQQMYESNIRIIGLVNDLLSVSRIDQGRVKDKPAPTDIQTVIAKAIEEMDAEVVKHQVKVVFSKAEQLPMLMLDPKQFREVMQNLLSNAVKYNRRGGKVTVMVIKQTSEVLIRIVDQGFGIPKKDQGKIFSKFFRAANAVTSETVGSGLGLFVVKSYVEAWGGKVSFESEEGKGSTFAITLPIRPLQHVLDKNLVSKQIAG